MDPRRAVWGMGVAGVMALALWLWIAPPHAPALARPGDEGVASAPEPAPHPSVAAPSRSVRILYQNGDGSARQPGSDPGVASEVLANITDIGPFSPEEARYLGDRLAEIAAEKEALLKGLPAQALTSRRMLEEAELVLAVETAKSAIAALKAGSYTVTENGAKSPSLALPACEGVKIGAFRGGRPCMATIIMPWKAHPDLAAARDFHTAMRKFDDTEKARAFNAMEDAQRDLLAARIRGILSSASPSQDDMMFVDRTLGFYTKLQTGSNIAIVPE